MDEYNKKPKVKKRRKKKGLSIVIIISLTICFLISIFLIASSVTTENKAKFTDDDWIYMEEYIKEEIGDGEEFVITEKKTEKIRELYKQRADDDGVVRDYYKTVGVRAIITGHFESQDEEYAIKFEKYLKDRPALKNGKAGTIICTNY